MKIWLDDERPAPEGWIWCKDPFEAIETIRNSKEAIEEMSLDHDLGYFVSSRDVYLNGEPIQKEVTGYRVLEIIELAAERGWWKFVPDKMTIHSANSGARKKMEQAVESIERLRERNN